jgi:hypothetical protein
LVLIFADRTFVAGLFETKRAQTNPGPRVLVTVHPSKRGSSGQLVSPQVAQQLIRLQALFKAHYAVSIDSFFRDYFQARTQAFPTFIQVYQSGSITEYNKNSIFT